MLKTFVLQAGIVASLLGFNSAHAVEDLSSSIYNVEVSSETVNYLQTYMPETQELNPAYISEQTDPNLRMIAEGDVSVTFISEGAGYRNSFGYFTYDDSGNILEEVTIFSNASAEGSGGSLLAGDTVNLGTFTEGENIGFWVTANGYADPNGYTYYSIDSLNPDGERHIAIVEDPATGALVIGFEDLYNLGDSDYNDVLFTVAVTPYDAIDTSNIPSGAPEASHIATLGIALAMLFAKSMGSGGFASRFPRIIRLRRAIA